MLKLNAGDKLICPLCGETYDDLVEDFFPPAQIGFASKADEQCCFCDGEFRLEKNAASMFSVFE